MTTYVVANNNPIIGKTKENGKQEIKVYDFKSGNMRYLEADTDKVDTFINTRNKKLKKTTKISTIIGAFATVGLGIAGAIAGKKVFDGDKFPGAMFGTFTGLVGALVGGGLAINKADENITQKFIEENK